MANAKGIRAGKAFVELFADDSRLVRGLRAAQRRLQKWGAMVRNIGLRVFAVGSTLAAPFVLATKIFSDAGDQLNKMSARTGISVESLSQLKFAAEQSGTSLGTLEGGVRNMQRSILDAERGLSTATDALDRLGLSVSDLKGLSPEQQFKLLAERISQVADPSTQAALAMKLFGRSGSQLLPLMKDGAAGIRNLMQEADQLGLTIGTDQAAAAAKFADAWNRGKQQLRAVAVQIGAAVAPALTKFLGMLSKHLKSAIVWIQQNKELVLTVLKVAGVIAAVGVAIVGLGVIFTSLGAVLGGITTAFTLLGTVIGAILSPIGLVVAAVVGMGAVITTQTQVGAAATDFLGSKFGELKDQVLESWQGIKDAIAAGDLELAFRIVMLTLQLLWKQGIAVLKKGWIGFKSVFQKAIADGLKFVMDIFGLSVKDLVSAFVAIEKAWVHTTSFLADTWNTFTAGFMKIWNKAKGFVAKGIVRLKKAFGAKVDVNAVSKEIDSETQRLNRQIDQRRNRQLAQRDQERKRRLQEIEDGRGETQKALENFLNDDKRREKFNRQRTAIDKEVEDAKKELADAIAEAAQKRKIAENKAANGKDKKLKPPPDVDLRSRVGAGRSSVIGSFNALSANQFGAHRGGRDPQEQVARNTRRMVLELTDIKDRLPKL